MPPPRRVPSAYSEAQVRRYLARIRFPGFVGSHKSGGTTTDSHHGAGGGGGSSGSSRGGATASVPAAPDVADAHGPAPLPAPTLANLAVLMPLHLATFPFENTHMHYEPHHTAHIDAQRVYERFIDHRKGGWCMQQNELLLHVLRRLGYRVFSATARGPSNEGWDHMVLLVWLPCHLGRPARRGSAYYAVDVGYGAAGMQRPMLLRDGHVERGVGNALHRIVRRQHPLSSFAPRDAGDADARAHDGGAHADDDDDDGGHDAGYDAEAGETAREVDAAQRLWAFETRDEPGDAWVFRWAASLVENHPLDYRELNHFVSTSPDVIFAKNLLLSLFLTPPDGPAPMDAEARRLLALPASDAGRSGPGGGGGAGELPAELPAELYPYHPHSLGNVTHMGSRFTLRPPWSWSSKAPSASASASASAKREWTCADERERVRLVRRHFGLLGDVDDEEALANMRGRPAELAAAPLAPVGSALAPG